jgi:hypothetical protein
MVCVLGCCEVGIQELSVRISDEEYMGMGDVVAGWCVSGGGSKHGEGCGISPGLV